LAPRVKSVYETVLYGPDLVALASFYEDRLGLRPVSEMGDLGVAFRLPDSGMLLLFDPEQAAAAGRQVPSHGTDGDGHVAFAIEPGEYDAWIEHLRVAGVEIERELTWKLGGRSIYVRDPAGNSVELVEGEVWPA
jgi:catechol 2,3-dioxygenase-like lactoylglutathione lyase family enzyme